MDNPHSTKSYDAQFLQQQQSTNNNRLLREAVIDLQTSGSNVQTMEYISHFIMTQMTAKAGIEKCGKVAVDALYQEFLQLHDLTAFAGQDASKLTK